MHTIIEESSLHRCRENSDTNSAQKDRKWIKRRIKATILLLNPTLQQLIVHMYTKFYESGFKTQSFNINMQYRERLKRIKKKTRSNDTESESRHGISHSTCLPILKILAGTVPEKNCDTNLA